MRDFVNVLKFLHTHTILKINYNWEYEVHIKTTSTNTKKLQFLTSSSCDREDKKKKGEKNGDAFMDLQWHDYLDLQICMCMNWHIPFSLNTLLTHSVCSLSTALAKVEASGWLKGIWKILSENLSPIDKTWTQLSTIPQHYSLLDIHTCRSQ